MSAIAATLVLAGIVTFVKGTIAGMPYRVATAYTADRWTLGGIVLASAGLLFS